jgi:hypothetical protein
VIFIKNAITLQRQDGEKTIKKPGIESTKYVALNSSIYWQVTCSENDITTAKQQQWQRYKEKQHQLRD